eukprot:gene8433-8521_t
MIHPVTIEEYLAIKEQIALIDVRTPAEFAQGRVPGAFNIPLFSNDERIKVGTTYKQAGREAAVLLGFDLTGSKWSGFIRDALAIAPGKKIAVHCWRGGMRSGAMAWALNLYGFDVYLVQGGYKSYRRWAIAQFDLVYRLQVLGGMTGSGKTLILNELHNMGEQVIDLEEIAQHQGSSYGSMNKLIQPTQEQFENELALHLGRFDKEIRIWVEDESLTIGKRSIPNAFWRQMRNTEIIEIKVAYEDRVNFLVKEYGELDKDFLIECTERIGKRLGPEQTKHAVAAIRENRMHDFIRLISPAILDKILHSPVAAIPDSRLLVGNDNRDDAAVLDLGNGTALISTTDFFMPIVDDAYDFGRIASANAISDVYAMGGKPVLAIAILGWPIEKLPPEVAQKVLEGSRAVCAEAGITLAGGHSIDCPEPVFGLAVNGIVNIDRLKQNSTAADGCYLYLTKALGVGILSTAQKRGLLRADDAAIALKSMTTLNKLGEAFGKLDAVKAMTDVTGFGLLVPVIDSVGYYLEHKCFPGGMQRNWSSYGHKVSSITDMQKYVLADPQTSGGLLVAVAEEGKDEFEQLLAGAGLNTVHLQPIGRLRQKSNDVLIESLDSLFNISTTQNIYGNELLKLTLSVVIGCALGLEREIRGKSAGFRVTDNRDRIAANVITGVGFIGAGVIFRTNISISGITTAASIWIAAAIGMLIGIGDYLLAIVSVSFSLVILYVLDFVQYWIDYRFEHRNYKVVFRHEVELQQFYAYIKSLNIKLYKQKIWRIEEQVSIDFEISGQESNLAIFNQWLMDNQGIKSFEW